MDLVLVIKKTNNEDEADVSMEYFAAVRKK